MIALQRQDLMKVIEDRHNPRATPIVSQLRAAHWHEYIGDTTLDRLLHGAHPIALTGESIRKGPAPLTYRDRYK